MDRITAFLNKRLAGIPAWIWGLIIGGSIALYAYLTRDEELTVAPETVPFVDEFAPGDAGDISGVPIVDPPDIPIETNPAWIRFVSDRLVADGEDPVLVQNALTKVLAGLEVTEQEAAMYALAVRRFGAPPEGAPPIVIKPSPEPKEEEPDPKPKPKPKEEKKTVKKTIVKKSSSKGKGKYVTTKKWPAQESTLWGIAEKHLGDGSKWPQIYNHSKNASLKRKRPNPNLIQPGDRWWVPGA